MTEMYILNIKLCSFFAHKHIMKDSESMLEVNHTSDSLSSSEGSSFPS